MSTGDTSLVTFTGGYVYTSVVVLGVWKLVYTYHVRDLWTLILAMEYTMYMLSAVSLLSSLT